MTHEQIAEAATVLKCIDRCRADLAATRGWAKSGTLFNYQLQVGRNYQQAISESLRKSEGEDWKAGSLPDLMLRGREQAIITAMQDYGVRLAQLGVAKPDDCRLPIERK